MPHQVVWAWRVVGYGVLDVGEQVINVPYLGFADLILGHAFRGMRCLLKGYFSSLLHLLLLPVACSHETLPHQTVTTHRGPPDCFETIGTTRIDMDLVVNMSLRLLGMMMCA